MSEWIIQGMGIVGAVLFNLSFQVKSNWKLYFLQTISNGIFAIQYFLLDSIGGAISLILSVIRNLLLCKLHDWKWVQWKVWPWIMSLISFGIMIFFWQGWISVLPFIAMVANNFGQWSDNAQTIRWTTFGISSPAWLTHNILVGSIGGILNDSFCIASTVISVFRFGWKNMAENNFDGKKRKE